MKIPAEVKAIRARMIAAFPVPTGEPGEAHEERLRQWSIRFAEQVAFELPGQGYGVKRSSPTNPISKDTLARSFDGRLVIWDLFTGSGTGNPRLNDDPDSDDITGQFFETRPEFFQPRNHLGPVVVVPPTPGPQPPAPPVPTPPPAAPIELSLMFARLDAVAADLLAVRQMVEDLATRPAPVATVPQALVGLLFGYRIRLTWEK